MRRSRSGGALVALSVGGLLALGMSPASADTQSGEIQQTVHVIGNGTVAHLDHSTIQSGSIRFAVSTTNPTTPDGGGSDITMFQPKAGVSVSRVLHDMQDEFSDNPRMAADGTREATHDARILGLADIVAGHPVVVTEYLSPGTYYVADLATVPTNGPPALTRLTVRPAGANIEQDSDLASQLTVRATSADRFIAPRDWPHQGTLTFKNVSDTMHFMSIQPVRPGTTDAQIQAYFDHPTGPPTFLRAGPTEGADVLTPGESLQLSYNLPRGTYALVCFVADDVTGMPHAFMGMHKVVVLH